MKEEWQAIDKKDDWDEDTGDYTIVCLNGILKKNYYEAESDDIDAPLLPMDVIAAGYLIYDEKIFKKFDIEKCKKYINRLSTSVKITKIPRNQFKDWTSLQSVTIGGNVNKISSGAFENCSSLNEFLYLGTKSQWLAIKKDSSWDKNTGNYTVMCSDGDLTKSQAQQPPIK